MGRVPIHVSDMIFAVDNDSELSREVARLPDIIPIGWYLLLTGGLAFALWWRYWRIAA